MIGYLENIKNKLTTRLAEAISAAGFACASVADKPCADWVQVRLVPVEKRGAHGVFTTNAALLVQHRQPDFESLSATAYGAPQHRPTSSEARSATTYGARHRQPDFEGLSATTYGAPSHRQPDSEARSATTIARAIMDRLSLDGLPVDRVAFAAPGFLNFYLVDGWQQRALEYILSQLMPLQAEQMNVTPADAASTDVDFEIKYAYNRICNQLELLADLGYQVSCVDEACFELLTAPQELRLMEHLAAAPLAGRPAQALEQASIRAQAQQYLSELAVLFHQFFNISPIRGEKWEIAAARISLLEGCRLVFESVLKELFL